MIVDGADDFSQNCLDPLPLQTAEAALFIAEQQIGQLQSLRREPQGIASSIHSPGHGQRIVLYIIEIDAHPVIFLLPRRCQQNTVPVPHISRTQIVPQQLKQTFPRQKDLLSEVCLSGGV